MSEYKTLIYKDLENGVSVITLNRPKCLNAFNNVSFMDMKAAVLEFESKKEQKVLIIKGSEKAFSAGDDIKYMMSGAITDGDDWVKLMQECFGQISRCRKPVIASIAGLAMGGGFELALMCDMIIAAEGTKISLPEISVGALPVCGGVARVTKICGSRWAKYLSLTGERITAEQAYTLGLVQKVVPAKELNETTLKMAETMATFPLANLIAIKRVADYSEDNTVERGMLMERDFNNYINAEKAAKK